MVAKHVVTSRRVREREEIQPDLPGDVTATGAKRKVRKIRTKGRKKREEKARRKRARGMERGSVVKLDKGTLLIRASSNHFPPARNTQMVDDAYGPGVRSKQPGRALSLGTRPGVVPLSQRA